MLKRQLYSNLILILFAALVATAALFSDMFKVSVKNGADALEQSRLFSSEDLKLIKRISLKNKSGEFTFERNENNTVSPWHMVTPRDLSANSLIIDKLFNALAVIKIKKIFPDEKLNNSNFSLDKPTATLTLSDENDKTIMIQVGLMNTIDNSTYLKVTGRSGIIHVEAPTVSLENLSLLDLIQSQIFPLNMDTISSFKINSDQKKDAHHFEILKKQGKWFDPQDNILSQDKVAELFQDLESLKSSFILDQQTEMQKKQIASLTNSPAFTVTISDNKASVINYTISTLTKSISELDLKNEEYFVVSMSNSTTSFVVKKEFYELFNRKLDSLRVNKAK